MSLVRFEAAGAKEQAVKLDILGTTYELGTYKEKTVRLMKLAAAILVVVAGISQDTRAVVVGLGAGIAAAASKKVALSDVTETIKAILEANSGVQLGVALAVYCITWLQTPAIFAVSALIGAGLYCEMVKKP